MCKVSVLLKFQGLWYILSCKVRKSLHMQSQSYQQEANQKESEHGHMGQNEGWSSSFTRGPDQAPGLFGRETKMADEGQNSVSSIYNIIYIMHTHIYIYIYGAHYYVCIILDFFCLQLRSLQFSFSSIGVNGEILIST